MSNVENSSCYERFCRPFRHLKRYLFRYRVVNCLQQRSKLPPLSSPAECYCCCCCCCRRGVPHGVTLGLALGRMAQRAGLQGLRGVGRGAPAGRRMRSGRLRVPGPSPGPIRRRPRPGHGGPLHAGEHTLPLTGSLVQEESGVTQPKNQGHFFFFLL